MSLVARRKSLIDIGTGNEPKNKKRPSHKSAQCSGKSDKEPLPLKRFLLALLPDELSYYSREEKGKQETK